MESNNFAIRKHVLKYDDVMNKQREVIYKERKKVLEGADISGDIQTMITTMISDEVDYATKGIEDRSQWDVESLRKVLSDTFTFGEKEFSVLRNINPIGELKEKIEENMAHASHKHSTVVAFCVLLEKENKIKTSKVNCPNKHINESENKEKNK